MAVLTVTELDKALSDLYGVAAKMAAADKGNGIAETQMASSDYRSMGPYVPPQIAGAIMPKPMPKNELLKMGLAQIEGLLTELHGEHAKLMQLHVDLWPKTSQVTGRKFNIIDNVYVAIGADLYFFIKLDQKPGTSMRASGNDLLEAIKRRVTTPRILVRTQLRISNALSWVLARQEGLTKHNKKQLKDHQKWINVIQGTEAVLREQAPPDAVDTSTTGMKQHTGIGRDQGTW